MAEERIERKLAAVFAADVAGYSRLMAANEEGTLRTLKSHRVTMDSYIAQHHGRIVGTAGDSVLAEFASPVEAVECAVEIQQELAERNSELPEHQQMDFRIGINLGDVIVDGPQIYGDGVNVAARLEGIADSGGICISGSILEQIKGKLPYHFQSQGRQKVKNIPERVAVYEVDFKGESQRPGYWRWATAAGVVLLIASAMAWVTGVFETEDQRLVMLKPPADLKVFRDCPVCPELAEIRAGKFTMGSSNQDEAHTPKEGPLHTVTIGKPFAIGRYEVTFAEWDACVAAGACRHKPNDRNWGRGNRPVIYVSWTDIQEYLAWLSRETGHAYRLPSEAEWEYVARGGTKTRYWWGDEFKLDYANCSECGSVGGEITVPIGSFPPNPFGIYDLHGNVWEWTQDCWNGTYAGAPVDGSPWQTGECEKRVLRGGAWGVDPGNLRTAHRRNDDIELRSGKRGFRVARDMP